MQISNENDHYKRKGIEAMPTLSQTTYTPQSFRKLWLWFAWLVGAGIPLTFIGIGVFLLIAGGVIGLILLYRFWSLIQDGKARTSPAQAVGFLFRRFLLNLKRAKLKKTSCFKQPCFIRY